MSHEPIRVVVLPMLRLSRELLEGALRSRADVQLVQLPECDDTPDGTQLARIVEESGARFVVAGFDGGALPPACAELLEAQASRVRVIAVETGAGEAALFELRPRQLPLGAITPGDLAETIRAAALAAPPRSEAG
jgi:hypothetical protein